ncbi:MAG: hypothetical protein EOM69_08440, partial [Clostridia bacterium]|nr:hypothetical protein [Clostridia bacterium]
MRAPPYCCQTVRILFRRLPLKKNKYRKLVRDWVFIVLGSAIYAAGVAFFLDPNSLAPGGVSGIA